MTQKFAANIYWYTIPLIISAYLAYCAGAVAALVIAALAAAIAAALQKRDSRIQYLILTAFLAAAAGIPGIVADRRAQERLFAELAGSPEIVDAVVRISDSECSPASAFLPPPSFMRAEVYTNGRVFTSYVSARERNIWPAVPGWGDTFLVTGRIKTPESPAGMPSLIADRAELISAGSGIFRYLLDTRDRIMDHVTGSFGNSDSAVTARGVTAALIFGCCQGVSREVMDNFVLTGTIHILSVSGLHIGILALTLSATLMFCGIKLRTRCFLAPALLLPYLVMTGCSIPAMRAWMMFTAWSICRAFLLRTPPLRILVLLAAATAILSPLDLLNMGFQYSFAVTAALLMLLPVLEEIHGLLEAQRRWMLPFRIPLKYPLRTDRIRRGTINTLLAAVTAFTAGLPLTLFYHGKAALAAVFLNILIAPLLPLAYLGVLPAALLPFEWSGRFCFRIIDLMVGIINMAGKTAMVPAGLGKPGWILCTAGTAGVLMMLASGNGRKLRLPGVILFVIFLAGCMLKPLFMTPGILVLVPAYSRQPAVAVCHPAFYSRKGILIAGDMDWECREAAGEFFFENGITELQNVIVKANNNETWYHLKRLAAELPVNSITVKNNLRKNSAALQMTGSSSPASICLSENMAGDFFGHQITTGISAGRCRIFFDSKPVAVIDGVSNHTRKYFIPLPEVRIP